MQKQFVEILFNKKMQKNKKPINILIGVLELLSKNKDFLYSFRKRICRK